jgi:predicted peptidase
MFPPARPGLLALASFLALSGSAWAEDPMLLTITGAKLDKRTFTDSKGKTIPYRLLKPDNYDPKKSYPLVVFFHGAGEHGDDNEKHLIHVVPDYCKPEHRKMYPCFLVAPQCPAGQQWVDCNWGADSHKQSAEPTKAVRQTLELVPALQKEFAIDARRLVTTGLSSGGFAVWDVIARKPDWFAAAVPCCGGGDEATAPRIAKIPIWAFHGDKDTLVKVSRSRNMIEALKKAGGTPKYTEYNTGDDLRRGFGCWGPAYDIHNGDGVVLLKWVFEQKKP